MAVRIAQASIDENGKAHGGAAGNQSGKELNIKNWYLNSKGWYVMRPKTEKLANDIVDAMVKAVNNKNIGYDQYQRDTLYNNVAPYGYDPSKTTKAVECDCSALVRTAVQYAFVKNNIDYPLVSFRTTNEVSVLNATGYFTKLTSDKYCKSSDYLKKGDILVTRTQGHTLVIIDNGAKAEKETQEPTDYTLGDRLLKIGMEGADVKQLQMLLIQAGYDCGKYGADGDFGDSTLIAVKAFQKDNNLEVDGIVGKNTINAFSDAIDETIPLYPTKVKIINGNCYVRVNGNTESETLGVARVGETFDYANVTTQEGWNKIKFGDKFGYVSGKYSMLLEEKKEVNAAVTRQTYLRAEPNENSEVLASIALDEKVNNLKEIITTEYTKIIYKDLTGWVPSQNLKDL